MIKKLVCIACPRGCRLTVTLPDTEPLVVDAIAVSGNRCPKGSSYGRQEVIRPLRTLTTTVVCRIPSRTSVGTRERICRLPVKTGCEVPLEHIMDILQEIHRIEVCEPVVCGSFIGTVMCGTDNTIPIIACANIEESA